LKIENYFIETMGTKYKIQDTRYKLGFTPHINCDKADPIFPCSGNKHKLTSGSLNYCCSDKSAKNCNRSYIAGFTLIEVLVTLGVLAILSAVLVGYASESSRQTVMLITRERIIQLLARTRSLSTSTFLNNVSTVNDPSIPKTCGYGLHVDTANGELFIFRDMVKGVDCSSSDYQYMPGTEDKQLDSSLDAYKVDLNRLDFGGDLKDVVFVPPNPDIYINGDVTGVVTKAEVNFKIKDTSGPLAEVNINNTGQVSWK
jgi:prepilin-type N-terminal cleavage/methylation domain-containing protein